MKPAALLALVAVAVLVGCQGPAGEARHGASFAAPSARSDDRMDWWREARFGLFIHWGLYAIPAGEWDGQTDHGEWIRTTAQIPRAEYDELVTRFNPTGFDPDEWCRLAKAAGMKYVVITSKHHDGFALFDSKVSDYDVMATPYGRDILAQLAGACERHGLKLCFYHSILDWRHPEYEPQITWEPERNPDPDFDAYTEHLRSQVTELLTGYGDVGVMWFDGEWESTWTTARGNALYALCRELQPGVIVNDRVSKGRREHTGVIAPGNAGDYATPEQNVPPSAPGEHFDWETCMTMNDHWGWNKHDDNWKSSRELIRTLVDVASKGGNYLLNVGPTETGEFPPEAVERLTDIGAWMEHHAESIHGTTGSIIPPLTWGRSTTRDTGLGIYHVYLHVLVRDLSGLLWVDGVSGNISDVTLLGAQPTRLDCTQHDGALIIDARDVALDGLCPVVRVTFDGMPSVHFPPTITSPRDSFIDQTTVTLSTASRGGEIRYTLDGSAPTAQSILYTGAFSLDRSAGVSARSFIDGAPVSGVAIRRFEKVDPIPPVEPVAPRAGLMVEVYEGEWTSIPDLTGLEPVARLTSGTISIPGAHRGERTLLRFSGFVDVPATGMYRFAITSDDGSRLTIAGRTIDNDGLHVAETRDGLVPLAAGLHPINAVWFNRTGDAELDVAWGLSDAPLEPLAGRRLRH